MSGDPPAKRFRIAFSFAGEKREFVEKAAAILANQFGESAILYDKFHEAEFANPDLALDLPAFYKNEADLIVSVFCPAYETKEWCGLEWRAIFSIIKEGGSKQIMLTRFEHTDGKGLFGLGGFIELDDKIPEQFATLILERLALNEGKLKGHYTQPAITGPVLKTSIPHNLPTLQPFFGREDELRKIADALDPDSRTWGALIDGPGGMGKTSLAVRAAYDASPEIFQKIIFISLKTRELDDDGVRDLSGFILSGLVELLNELARELGCDDIAKAPDDQRPRLLLDSLRGTQTLLVLDNLESLIKSERDTLFTFVKKLPAGCKAILTSRGRIGSGAEELILEKLSEEAALATLAELATHNPLLARTSEAERLVLYRETAGKPLLLRWTAGQLGRGHCLTFTDALHFIRSCPPGNDPLEFIFGDLVEDFDEAETQVLCALTYFTLPASIGHIHAIADPSKEWKDPDESDSDDEEEDEAKSERKEELSIAAVEKALRSLANRSLAVPTDELQAFTLVPMVADFLRKKKPEVVAETGDRLEKRAYALIVENGYEQFDQFPKIEAKWPLVSAALPIFITGPYSRLKTACEALLAFLNNTGRWDECLSIEKQTEKQAIKEGDFINAGWCAYYQAWILYLRSQPEALLNCARRTNDHWHKANAGNRERGRGVGLPGLSYLLSGNYSDAIQAFANAIELFGSLEKETEDLVLGLIFLGIAHQKAGMLDCAEDNYRKGLTVALRIGFKRGIASATGNLSALVFTRGEWIEAETLACQALSLSEVLGRREFIASNCQRLAQALVRQGKAAEALPHAQRAVELFARLGSPDLTAAQAILAECEDGRAAG